MKLSSTSYLRKLCSSLPCQAFNPCPRLVSLLLISQISLAFFLALGNIIYVAIGLVPLVFRKIKLCSATFALFLRGYTVTSCFGRQHHFAKNAPGQSQAVRHCCRSEKALHPSCRHELSTVSSTIRVICRYLKSQGHGQIELREAEGSCDRRRSRRCSTGLA